MIKLVQWLQSNFASYLIMQWATNGNNQASQGSVDNFAALSSCPNVITANFKKEYLYFLNLKVQSVSNNSILMILLSCFFLQVKLTSE